MKKNKATVLVQDEYVLRAKDTKLNDFSKDAEFNVKSIVPKVYQKQFVKPVVTEGKLPTDGQKEIVISPEIAKKIAPNTRISSLIGKEISLKFLATDEVNHYPSRWDQQNFKVTGIIEKPLVGEDYAYIPYDMHKIVAKRSRFLGKNEDIPTNNMSVYLKDKATVNSVYEDFKKKYDVTRPVDILKGLTNIFENLNTIVLLAAILILIISAIMIGIILYISVLERHREIGLLISVGATKSDIKKIFLAEAMFIGAISFVIGVLLAIILKSLINPVMMKMMNYPIYEPSLLTSTATVLFGVGVSLLASFIPANNAANLLPMDLLKRN